MLNAANMCEIRIVLRNAFAIGNKRYNTESCILPPYMSITEIQSWRNWVLQDLEGTHTHFQHTNMKIFPLEQVQIAPCVTHISITEKHDTSRNKYFLLIAYCCVFYDNRFSFPKQKTSNQISRRRRNNKPFNAEYSWRELRKSV